MKLNHQKQLLKEKEEKKRQRISRRLKTGACLRSK